MGTWGEQSAVQSIGIRGLWFGVMHPLWTQALTPLPITSALLLSSPMRKRIHGVERVAWSRIPQDQV